MRLVRTSTRVKSSSVRFRPSPENYMMPPETYKQIWVPTKLKAEIKARAKKQGLSIMEFLQNLIKKDV